MGSGEKAFVAGADIKEIKNLSQEAGTHFSETGQAVFNKIEKCLKPVIALVNGFALGGGCELAMACHIRIASEKARFGQPEVNLGLIPGYGGTQRLPRLVGRGLALELLMSGDMISADRAYEIGLVNRVVPEKDLQVEGLQLMKTIISKGLKAVEFMLEVVHKGLNLQLEQGIELEAKYFGKACATDDMKEGTSAFFEKRKPDFKGK
jgi:enoyl-CoA hydratase